MRIDFLGLEAFLSIAERGSFHRAAASLNLSQTALSHRIRKLEEDLGSSCWPGQRVRFPSRPRGWNCCPRHAA